MTFKEFNLTMIKHPVLGRLLPLQSRRTYPALTLEDGKLCASFVGYHANPLIAIPGAGARVLFTLTYYLKVTYPQCSVRAFVRLPGNYAQGAFILRPQSKQIIQRLSDLCDQTLTAFEQQSEDIENVLHEYNTLLRDVLEPEQQYVLDRMMPLENPEQM